MPEWLSIVIRSLTLIVFVFVMARLLGKRQITQFTLFDLITGTVLGVIAAVVSINLVDIIPGLISLTIWALVSIGLHFLSLKFKAVHDVLMGKETVLINHGKVLEDKLFEARLTPEDLLSKLRQKNIFQVADVEFAVLEPNGDVSVMLKKDNQPLTAKTVALPVEQQSVPQTVMLDGTIMDEPLTALGLNRNWLYTELKKVGVAPENVFLAQVDSFGQLYLDLFDDALLVPKPKSKELSLATLKKCQADCTLFALGTNNQQAKKMYTNAANQLKQVIVELEPILKR